MSKWFQSDITIKSFSDQSKLFLPSQKCIFIQYQIWSHCFWYWFWFQLNNRVWLPKTSFPFTLYEKYFICFHCIYFSIIIETKKYKITLFDFYFLVDMQSKFSSVKTMRCTSDSSSITYAWCYISFDWIRKYILR